MFSLNLLNQSTLMLQKIGKRINLLSNIIIYRVTNILDHISISFSRKILKFMVEQLKLKILM